MPTTIAIVLNWRDAPSTCECIGSLLALNGDLGIIVVDNDSGDGSLEAISQHCAQRAPAAGYAIVNADATSGQAPGTRWLTVVSSGRNGGYAYGNNVGMCLALSVPDCRYFWILNADVVVPAASALTNLVAYMDAHIDIGLCGATVCYADGSGIVQTLGGGCITPKGKISQFGQGQALSAPIDVALVERNLQYINGACVFVRRSFVEDVGLMNESYFLYFEELEWSARGRGRHRIGYCHSSIVLHHVGKSIGTSDSGKRSTLSTYYLNASRLRFMRHHMKGAIPWVVLDTSLELLRNIRRAKWRTAAAIGCALLHTGPVFPKRIGLF
jgi:GT2 family glycosyltransferase